MIELSTPGVKLHRRYHVGLDAVSLSKAKSNNTPQHGTVVRISTTKSA
jgi:hypothetical protein